MNNDEVFVRRGNVEGKAILAKASDPLKKVLVLLNESTDKKLRDMAFKANKSKSELIRELIREALEMYITI